MRARKRCVSPIRPIEGRPSWRLPRVHHIVQVPGRRIESEAVGTDAHPWQAANRVVVGEK
jgi:hypothetical protein